jgi:hypothetical protein
MKSQKCQSKIPSDLVNLEQALSVLVKSCARIVLQDVGPNAVAHFTKKLEGTLIDLKDLTG